jgi:hypothetical protein
VPTSYMSSITGTFWVNPEYPPSANFLLQDSDVDLWWDQTDISTLTAWTTSAGPDGAVIKSPDPSIYPYSVPLEIVQLLDETTSPNLDRTSEPVNKFVLIIGILVGVLLLVGAVVLLFWHLWWRRHDRKRS